MGPYYFDSQLWGLIQAKKKVDAIILLRKETTASLKEAKDYVDAMETAGGPVKLHARKTPALPGAPTDAYLYALIQDRKKVQAIKEYRQATGASLYDAKQYCDEVERTGLAHGFATPPATISILDEAIIELWERGQRVEAIKFYRRETGTGLQEGKDYCEAVYANRHAILGAIRSTVAADAKLDVAAERLEQHAHYGSW